MKQRITTKDLAKLTSSQQIRLNELWTPALFDVAAAFICKDIATNEIDSFEFVVGGIGLYGTHIFLTDLKAVDDIDEDEEQVEDYMETDSAITVDSETFEQVAESIHSSFDDDEDYYDEFDEDDLESNYIRPDTFEKQDCIPLLNIGQMIDILQKNNFGNSSFQLYVGTYDLKCEMGNENSSWDTYEEEYKTGELCDVLWEALKEML